MQAASKSRLVWLWKILHLKRDLYRIVQCASLMLATKTTLN